MDWINANWGYIATVLFALSEIIGAMPTVQASGVFTAIVNTIKSLTAKAAKENVDAQDLKK